MSRPLIYRLYREGDEHGILELMNACNMKRTIDDWNWEYRDNPFGQLIGVVDCQGQIVGHMAWVSTHLKLGEKIVIGSQAVDLVVHPDFRGQGIFLAIGRFMAEEAGKRGNEATYGFPNKPAHGGHLKYGWFDVFEVPMLIRPLNLQGTEFLESFRFARLLGDSNLIRKLVHATLRSTLKTLSFLSRIFNGVGRINGSGKHTIRVIESFDSRFDDFWKDVSIDYGIAVCRDKEFLNWRYFKKPKGKYTIFVAEENDRILGYVVLLAENAKRLGYIVDILARTDQKGVIQSLTQKAIEYFKRENIGMVVCWMSRSNSVAKVYYKILNAQGFVRLFGRSSPLIARANVSNLSQEYLGNPKNWYITIGDSDYI